MADNSFVTQSAKETENLGAKIGRDLKKQKKGQVLALYGQLGSGKTTFVKGLAKGLGIKSRILSPTYVFVREYPFFKKARFYHLDFYRLDHFAGAQKLGLKEILAEPQVLVAIEWPEKVQKLLPRKRTDVFFKYQKNNQRKILIKQR